MNTIAELEKNLRQNIIEEDDGSEHHREVDKKKGVKNPEENVIKAVKVKTFVCYFPKHMCFRYL